MLVVLGIIGASVYFLLDPKQFPFPRCPFHLLTGLFCPGCGSQRATHALLHGRLGEAAGFNLLAVVCTPLLLLGAVDGLWASLSGVPRRAALLYQPWLGWAAVGLTVAFTITRNLPGPLGHWLAP